MKTNFNNILGLLDKSVNYGFAERRKNSILIALLILLICLVAISTTRGAYKILLNDVYKIVLVHIIPIIELTDKNNLHNTIVWELRMPRIILAVMVGAALASAGATYQGCFRNPLVDPFILGVSSGAAFGAALSIVFSDFLLSVQASAFILGSIAVILTYSLARVEGRTLIVTLILAGVIIGSIFDALLSIMKYLATDAALREIVFWLMGGFYYASWKDVYVVTIVVALCFTMIWILGWKLNVLSMGDDEARALGVNPEKYKIILITLATLMTSITVSIAGIIPWVGLMMPHAARMVIGPDHRFLLPAAALLGASYLLICDTLARTLTSSEIPVGIIASLLGAPYLFYLLRTRGKYMEG